MREIPVTPEVLMEMTESRCMPEGARKIRVTCGVNGKPAALEAYPMARLLDVLREELASPARKKAAARANAARVRSKWTARS